MNFSSPRSSREPFDQSSSWLLDTFYRQEASTFPSYYVYPPSSIAVPSYNMSLHSREFGIAPHTITPASSKILFLLSSSLPACIPFVCPTLYEHFRMSNARYARRCVGAGEVVGRFPSHPPSPCVRLVRAATVLSSGRNHEFVRLSRRVECRVASASSHAA